MSKDPLQHTSIPAKQIANQLTFYVQSESGTKLSLRVTEYRRMGSWWCGGVNMECLVLQWSWKTAQTRNRG